jgi:hypothetical protein
MFGAKSQQSDAQPSSMSTSRRHRAASATSPTPSTSSLLPYDTTTAEVDGFGRHDAAAADAAAKATSQDADRQGGDATEVSLLLDPSHCPGQGHAAVAPVARRRAVDASDLRQCALVQTKMKAWKSGLVDLWHTPLLLFCIYVRAIHNRLKTCSRIAILWILDIATDEYRSADCWKLTNVVSVSFLVRRCWEWTSEIQWIIWRSITVTSEGSYSYRWARHVEISVRESCRFCARQMSRTATQLLANRYRKLNNFVSVSIERISFRKLKVVNLWFISAAIERKLVVCLSSACARRPTSSTTPPIA